GFGDGYLLGTGTPHRIIDVAKMFGVPYRMVPARRGERTHGRADTDKARSLGWAPKVSLDAYVADFVAAHPLG
ncbi:MAG TPA: ADP-L-glycero-D-manno-heptose-6-epimerase, partial [Micromonosporaceae bacterium]|nr:ADP-L-glycero-D-manno-heptose-6-epimerase [Micromonosporaceae bacterium]